MKHPAPSLQTETNLWLFKYSLSIPAATLNFYLRKVFSNKWRVERGWNSGLQHKPSPSHLLSFINSPEPNKTKTEELKQTSLISKPTGLISKPTGTAKSKYSHALPIPPQLHLQKRGSPWFWVKAEPVVSVPVLNCRVQVIPSQRQPQR